MTKTFEEEIVLLYTLYCCGERTSPNVAKEFILSNQLLMRRAGDFIPVSTGEFRIENRIAWTRQNLKDRGELEMVRKGIWKLTQAGKERLFGVARQLFESNPLPESSTPTWERFSPAFLIRMRKLGEVQSRWSLSGAPH